MRAPGSNDYQKKSSCGFQMRGRGFFLVMRSQHQRWPEQFFNAVYNDEIDIIIGTQMVAKGPSFP
jgi:hypothetical protein